MGATFTDCVPTSGETPFRLIHWKASARAGQLLVRQHSAESAEGFSIWVDPVG
jgi:uncharacterized protein (DUF58 family)